MLASGSVLGAFAQTAPTATAPVPAGPEKIGVIAFEIAVAKTNEGAKIFADLEKKFAPREAELKSLNDEIQKDEKDLQAQSATLTDADRAAKTKAIDEKKKKLQRGAEDLNNDGKQEMQQQLSALGPKVYDVLVDYAKKNGYTVILDANQQERAVLYAVESANITQAVIDAYNAKSGVPAPAAPAAAGTKPPVVKAAPAAH